MIAKEQEDECSGRDTTMCGDPISWFPMRVVGKEGKHVLITGGVFDGVTGVIRRVKRCKRVVIELEGIATVAIAFVPSVLLKEVEN